MKKKVLSFFTVVTILIQIYTAANVIAEVKGPGWFTVTADPVTPEESEAYFQSEAKSLEALKAKESYQATSFSSAVTLQTTDEITELARALQNDPKLIYDYVHNHIDYVPYFGALKGPTLTYLDGSGNDYDLASLMIALLRASGFTAQYEYGTMSFSTYDLPLWLRVDLSSVWKVLANGGIPYTYYEGGAYTNISRVWVRATIDDSDYVFDPAWKTYSSVEKIDIGQAIGYNRNDILASATAGATLSSDYVQDLNEGGLGAKLSEYSMNLVGTLRSTYPNSGMKEIVGGWSIDQTELIDYTTSFSHASKAGNWDEVPIERTTTLRVAHVGIDHTFAIPEIAGKRLTITYASGDNHPELRFNGELIAAGSPTSIGSKYDMILTVDHPYAAEEGTFADQTAIYDNMSGSISAIISDFGCIRETLVSKRQRILDTYIAEDLLDTSEAILGETLNIIGLNWLKELRMTRNLLGALSKEKELVHHRIGRVSQESSYYIDVKNMMKSTVRQADSNGMASFLTGIFSASALEHGVLEQLMGTAIPGVSTVKLLQIANAIGNKVYLADSTNFSIIRSQLLNYSTTKLEQFESDLASSPGSWIIIPEIGELSVEQWKGVGYILKKGEDFATGFSVAMTISGDLFGGYGTIPGVVHHETVQDNTYWNIPSDSLTEIDNTFSDEPVEMGTGAYYCVRSDLNLGSAAPLGLSFSRTYNSGKHRSQRTLGYGWTHNNDIYLGRLSHGDPSLAGRQPVDAAALITAFYISLDLLTNQDDLEGRMISVLISKWAIDQLIENAVIVHMGNKVMEFIELPDGTYASPPGITTELVDNGDGTFHLDERFGEQMVFDKNNRITTYTDVDGNTMTFTYTNDNLSKVQDAFGRSLTQNYTDGRISLVIDSAGRSVSYGYDAKGNLITYTDPEGKIWHYAYDSNHRMTSLTNPLGIITATNTYDSLGRVKTQNVPRQSGTATYNFYFSGFRNVEEDPYGKETIYHRDDKGRIYSIENSLGHQTIKKIDGQNHEIEVTDPRGNTTFVGYDGNNNLISIKNALNHETTNTYDTQFRLTATIDPLNHTTRFDYDSEHHLIKITDAEGNEQGLTYYSNGRINTKTDGRGIVTTMTYDNYGNLRTTKTGNHPFVTYAYDTIGRMISLTDNVGSKTTFVYDKRGLLLSSTDPLGRTTTYTYDNAGRITSITDRNNDSTTYSYTPSAKLEKITYPDVSEIAFTYNLHDKCTSMQDAIGTTSYTYDDIYRVIAVTDPYSFTASYEYDEAGNVTKIIYPSGLGYVSYTYDILNRMKTVAGFVSYTYDAAGRLVRLKNLSNGTLTTYDYDHVDRLISLENRKSDNSIISTYNFTLDANGNRTQIVQDEPIMPGMTSSIKNFTYNQKKNRLLKAGSSTYSYDNEGQLSNRDGIIYTFDYAHRLTSIDGVNPVQYFYDGKGTRLQAVRNGVTTHYIYDRGNNLLAEADDSNTITRLYIHGLGLLAMITETGTYSYHYNGIGSTIAITDQSQNIVSKYTYTPFGIIRESLQSPPQPFKYVGEYGVMTEPNGLYYMDARYYDPQVGRFISEDPIGFGGGDVNLYAYVKNNPINYIDPNGRGREVLDSNDFFEPGATSVDIPTDTELAQKAKEYAAARNNPGYLWQSPLDPPAPSYPTAGELDNAIRDFSTGMTATEAFLTPAGLSVKVAADAYSKFRDLQELLQKDTTTK